MKKSKQKGFTIVELAIVITVIAVLAAITVPTLTGIVEKAKESAALKDVKSAYEVTFAEDIKNNTSVVYGAEDKIIVKHDNGVIVSIDTDGAVEVVEYNQDDQDDQDTPVVTHSLKDGKLVTISDSDDQ